MGKNKVCQSISSTALLNLRCWPPNRPSCTNSRTSLLWNHFVYFLTLTFIKQGVNTWIFDKDPHNPKPAKAIYLFDALHLTLLAIDWKVPSEVPRLSVEKCISYLLFNLVEIISLTQRDHSVRVNCPAKDEGDGRHVLIFHFVGVSKHGATRRGCNEADRMC